MKNVQVRDVREAFAGWQTSKDPNGPDGDDGFQTIKELQERVSELQRVLIVCLILLIFIATNCPCEAVSKKEYTLSGSEELTLKENGINGKVKLWLFKSIRKDSQRENFFDDSIKKKCVILSVVDKRDKEVVSFQLEGVLLAWFEKTICLPDHPNWKAIAINDDAGFGSYTGNFTKFFSINKTEIVWLKDQNTGDEIHLLRSLKSDWKLCNKDKNSILYIYCRPTAEVNDTAFAAQFKITYIRYLWNSNGIYSIRKTEPGFWENEGIFPDETRFPE